MLKKYTILLLILLSGSMVYGQNNDHKLAQHYFKLGEYEKSAELFQKLSNKSGFNEYYFNQYGASKEIQKTLKKYPKQVPLYVTYGNLLERQAKTKEADEQYRKAIKIIPADRGLVNNLGNSFMRLTKYDLAKEVFEKGNLLLNDSELSQWSYCYNRKNKLGTKLLC